MLIYKALKAEMFEEISKWIVGNTGDCFAGVLGWTGKRNGSKTKASDGELLSLLKVLSEDFKICQLTHGPLMRV